MCKHSLDKVWGGEGGGAGGGQSKRLRSLEEGGEERQTDRETVGETGQMRKEGGRVNALTSL